MKKSLAWGIQNAPAMNTVMVAVLLTGAASLALMRREVFPEFELEMILISVPYPGASPGEVEEGICQKMEEAVRPIARIKRQISIAREGTGFLILELDPEVPDVQKTLNEVRSVIDRIPSFPELAEDPEVKQITLRQPAIRVNITGPRTPDVDEQKQLLAELRLREIAEEIREDLLQLPTVSQANTTGARDYQIDIEVSEATLRQYALSLQDVAEIVRRQNVELPGGSLKTESQEVRLRGKNKRLLGTEIADIPLITDPQGIVHTIGDLAEVRDHFVDETAVSFVNNKPALVISVDRTSSEDLLDIVAEVKHYIAGKKLPFGYNISTWYDQSVNVRDRMELLTTNGLQGLVLVFLVLAIFLELRLAFWVSLGIPTAVLGSAIVLIYSGHTLNMLSMFAFLMALGIVVDDAIVIGENIYAHRSRNPDLQSAAVEGAYEVLPAVTSSVCTTIIAFVPLMFVAGIMGKFIAVMPVAVIAMLIISLLESFFILPCHLGHERSLLFVVIGLVFYPFRPLSKFFSWCNGHAAYLLEWIVQKVYIPSLTWSLKSWPIVLSSAFAILLVTWGFLKSGITPWVLMPELDSYLIEARILYPDGTPGTVTDQACKRLERAIQEINRRHSTPEVPLVRYIYRAVGSVSAPGIMGPDGRAVGSHVGLVEVEMVDSSQRKVHSEQILAEWREEAGNFPGAESLKFGTPEFGPGGTPIEFKLLARKENMETLETVVEKYKQKLASYPGVFDIADDSQPGKWEFQLRVKEKALALGVPLATLAETVRASYYGEEVMRLQRGRHEVKLMVRYPQTDRRSLADFEEIRVRTAEGTELPLTELAEITVARGYSEINRVDQLRAITITADVDTSKQNARKVVQDLKRPGGFLEQMRQEYPQIRIRWEGQQEQTSESLNSLLIGFLCALFAMFVLLTLQFRSYLQPLLILVIIPFGTVGAIWGHSLMGMPLTLFSVFGLIALTGVVVNDSIVLIDCINRNLRQGMALQNALLHGGRRRFRPVLLTSITTIAGLMPILAETSFQAQILIPMATSLCFGLMLATVLVLILVPVFYYIFAHFQRLVFLPLMTLDSAVSSSTEELDTADQLPTAPATNE
ncbi:MAG: multidrug transporter [Planctomycetaceae bacterium]|nr:multidrug transporter [Planctomycetaceae bacterium]MBP62778.1 multidrug transporter [Planctomycetaceae bacterium]